MYTRILQIPSKSLTKIFTMPAHEIILKQRSSTAPHGTVLFVRGLGLAFNLKDFVHQIPEQVH